MCTETLKPQMLCVSENVFLMSCTCNSKVLWLPLFKIPNLCHSSLSIPVKQNVIFIMNAGNKQINLKKYGNRTCGFLSDM